MAADLPGRLFSPAQWARLRKLVELHEGAVLTEFDSPAARAVLAETEVLITGWASPRLDEAALAAAPRLRAVLHAAGSVKGHVAPAAWRRGVLVSTAAQANAEPVAEYTLAMMLLALKGVRTATALYRERRQFVDVLREFPGIGNHERQVGLVGASRIGRRVIELLRPFSLELSLADPYLEPGEARELGVRLLPLDDLLRECELVSVHAPAIPETRHMIDGRRLALLRDGAVLVNTARGSLIDQDALVAELVSGRIEAVLDVTEPEVLSSDSPLYTLPNVWLTPHLAGAQGSEVHRLADVVLEELARYTVGLPLAHPVFADELDRIA
jgi:phosphoglycerate dehydrogenase-like enzyme